MRQYVARAGYTLRTQGITDPGEYSDLASLLPDITDMIVNDELILPRMTGRRSCPKCGAVYHVQTLKPKVEGKCDKGCGDLVQRADDTPDVVGNRLKTYHQQTAAVVGYYKSKGAVILDIDAAQEIDQVTQAVFKQLDTLKK